MRNKLKRYSIKTILVLLILESSIIRTEGSVIFQEDFEFDVFPLYYQPKTNPQCFVGLDYENYFSGQQSLHLQTLTDDFGCHLEIPLGILFEPDLKFTMFQYFEVSIPFYEIYVSGESDEIDREIILEYGNPDQDWVDRKFLVRGLDNIPQGEWYQFEYSIAEDLELAFTHQNRPYNNFQPKILNKLRLALDPADPGSQRSIYIDLIEFTSGILSESEISTENETTTSYSNFNKILTWIIVVPSVTAIMIILIILIRRRVSLKLQGGIDQ